MIVSLLNDLSTLGVAHLGLAGLCFLSLAALCAYALFVRRRKGERPPRVVRVGAGVALGGALSFGIGYLIIGDDGGSGRLELALALCKEVPVLAIVAYVCSVQIRKYRLARNHRPVRQLFGASPYVLLLCFGLYAVVNLSFPYPFYELGDKTPPHSLVSLPFLVSVAVLGLVSSIVFASAVTSELAGFRARLQNTFAAFGMAALSARALTTAIFDVLHVFGPLDLLPALFMAQYAGVAAEVVGLTGAALLYYSRSRNQKLFDDFLNFAAVVDEMSLLIENAPIRNAGLSVHYEALQNAARTQLRLTEEEFSKVRGVFRAVTAYVYDIDGRELHSVAAWDQLLHLARIHDDELEHLFQRDGSNFVGLGTLMSTYRTLDPILDCLGQKKAGTTDFTGFPDWVQLCAVALADSELLPHGYRQEILNGRMGINQEVLAAYSMEKLRIRQTGFEFEENPLKAYGGKDGP